MSAFPVYTIESAPERSKPVLDELQRAFGIIPNIAGAIAGSPVLINGFIAVFKGVHSGSFSEAQIQTLLLTNAVTNACTWAVAFHTFLALKEGLEHGDVEAIRNGGLPRERKHAALSQLARTLIARRGHLADADVDAFLAAGFSREQVLEVIAVVAASTITNYAGSVAKPPLEDAFQAYRWSAPAA
ncbi:carboxymuconolactone decarboxylase family protein [Trinickia terrae]|uniref:Carboxymuconolactone decarboxylase family protein n=1 Tax=Trinickia terrae TaxID=2571161 RepID=A0A4U1HPK7_9BURK|nr:carboxymuconolactone decarboxylase family protein [Trinickia terrae]TKC81747.1 carboxymuconolactone decarboxylase family protein [Trinickia terrae]